MSIHLSVNLFVCLSDCLSVCLSIYLSDYLIDFSCLTEGLTLNIRTTSVSSSISSIPQPRSCFDHNNSKSGQKIYRGKGAKQLAAELEAGQQLKGELAEKADSGAGEAQGRGVTAVAMGPPHTPVIGVGVGTGHDGMKITNFDADADRPSPSSDAVSFSFTDIRKRTSDGEDHSNAGNSTDHADQQEGATALSSSVYKAQSEFGSSSSAEEAVSGVDNEMQTAVASRSLSGQTCVPTLDTFQPNEIGSDEEVLDTYVRDQGQSHGVGQGVGHTERTKRKFNDLEDVHTNELSDHRKETEKEAEAAEIDIDVDVEVALPLIERLEESVIATGLSIP